METNKIVKMTLAETGITLAQLGEAYGVSKQAIHQKLQKEQPEEVQEEMRHKILDMARERIRRAEAIA